MIRKLILVGLLLGLSACAAAVSEPDNGIGGTGAPAAQIVVV